MRKENGNRSGYKDGPKSGQTGGMGEVLHGVAIRQLLHDGGPTPQERRFPGAQPAIEALQKAGYRLETIQTHDLTFARTSRPTPDQPLELTERFSPQSAYFITAQHQTTGEYLVVCVIASDNQADAQDVARITESTALASICSSLKIPAADSVFIRIFDTTTHRFDQPLSSLRAEPTASPVVLAEAPSPEKAVVQPLVDFSITQPERYSNYLHKLAVSFKSQTGQELSFGQFQTTALLDGVVKITTVPVTLTHAGHQSTISLALVWPPTENFRNFFGVVTHILARTAQVRPQITAESIHTAFKKNNVAALVAKPDHRVGEGQLAVLNAAFAHERFQSAETLKDPEALYSPSGLRDIAEQVVKLPEVRAIISQGLLQENSDWFYNFQLQLVSGSTFQLFLLAPKPKLRTLKDLHEQYTQDGEYPYTLPEFTALLQAKQYCILVNNGVRLDQKQLDILRTTVQRTELEVAEQNSDVTEYMPPALLGLLLEKGFSIGWPGGVAPVGVFTFSSEPLPLQYVRMQRKNRLFRVIFVPEVELRGQDNLKWLQGRVLAEMATVAAFAKNNILVILSGKVEPAADAGGKRPIILTAESHQQLTALIDAQRAE